jgi:raffinose/stachyose/melibiose transport system permease protein
MFGRLQTYEKWVLFILLFSSGLLWVLPLLYLIGYSFGGGGLENYKAVITLELFPRILFNSIFISTVVVLGLVIVVSLGAYGFSKHKFAGDKLLFSTSLIGLMVPPAAMLVPLFQTIKTFGWINSYLSLIGPEIALLLPFSLLIARNYFDEIPNEIMEAAEIDGAGSWGQFYHIILPLGVPILMTVGILGFLHSWNEYLLPLSFINEQSMLTVTMSPKFFIEEYTADYHKVFAALVLISIPIIILYLFGQKYLQRGLTSGAIK